MRTRHVRFPLGYPANVVVGRQQRMYVGLAFYGRIHVYDKEYSLCGNRRPMRQQPCDVRRNMDFLTGPAGLGNGLSLRSESRSARDTLGVA